MNCCGDFKTERWVEDACPDDVVLKQDAGVAVASLCVFSWAQFPPSESELEIAWRDRSVK